MPFVVRTRVKAGDQLGGAIGAETRVEIDESDMGRAGNEARDDLAECSVGPCGLVATVKDTVGVIVLSLAQGGLQGKFAVRGNIVAEVRFHGLAGFGCPGAG